MNDQTDVPQEALFKLINDAELVMKATGQDYDDLTNREQGFLFLISALYRTSEIARRWLEQCLAFYKISITADRPDLMTLLFQQMEIACKQLERKSEEATNKARQALKDQHGIDL